MLRTFNVKVLRVKVLVLGYFPLLSGNLVTLNGVYHYNLLENNFIANISGHYFNIMYLDI